MTAPDARNEAVQFLYKHGELTYSAAAAAIAKLCDNGFHITRAPLAEALAVSEVAALVKAAYEQGANDVHANWQADKAPDFSEAASDYAAAALRAIGEGRNG